MQKWGIIPTTELPTGYHSGYRRMFGDSKLTIHIGKTGSSIRLGGYVVDNLEKGLTVNSLKSRATRIAKRAGASKQKTKPKSLPQEPTARLTIIGKKKLIDKLLQIIVGRCNLFDKDIY